MKELAIRGVETLKYERSDHATPTSDAELGALLRDPSVCAVISAANAGDVLSPTFCARYGIDPSKFKVMVDVGFVAHVNEDGRFAAAWVVICATCAPPRTDICRSSSRSAAAWRSRCERDDYT